MEDDDEEQDDDKNAGDGGDDKAEKEKHEQFMTALDTKIDELQQSSATTGIEIDDDNIVMGDETAHKKRTVDDLESKSVTTGTTKNFASYDDPIHFLAQLPSNITAYIMGEAKDDKTKQKALVEQFVNEQLSTLPALQRVHILGLPNLEQIPAMVAAVTAAASAKEGATSSKK